MKLTVREAAVKYGLPISTLYEKCREGYLPTTTEKREIRPGRVLEVQVVDVKDLAPYIAKQKAKEERDRLQAERLKKSSGKNREVTIQEAMELYGFTHKTYASAIHKGELPARNELRYLDSQGQKRWMYILQTADIEAWMSTRKKRDQTSKAEEIKPENGDEKITLREAAEVSGLSMNVLQHAVAEGVLKATMEPRLLKCSKHSYHTRSVRVVTREALNEFMEYRAKMKPSKQRRKSPPLVNPYPDEWKQGVVPKHLRLLFWEFVADVMAEAAWQRSQERKREVAT